MKIVDRTPQKIGKEKITMIEQEVKVRIEDREKLIKKLNELGYKKKNSVIQRTYRCWRPDRLFSRAGIFPRTRNEKHYANDGSFIKEENTITVKSRYKDPERGLFERQEKELFVENAKTMAEALALLGMSDQRILEKERFYFQKEEQEVTHVLLDRFCFGSYLEIEDTPETIEELLKELGVSNSERLGMAYWDVYWHYCKDKGIEEKRDLLLS